MADEKKSGNVAPGETYEGHGDNTQPASILSPATFAPLSQEPKSVNSKSDTGKKGKES